MKMEWSNNPPTEPGLYQYRPPDAGMVVFLEIERASKGELVAVTNNSLEHTKLESLPGQWRGPILDREKRR